MAESPYGRTGSAAGIGNGSDDKDDLWHINLDSEGAPQKKVQSDDEEGEDNGGGNPFETVDDD